MQKNIKNKHFLEFSQPEMTTDFFLQIYTYMERCI